MNSEVKIKWVAALRSNKYKQTTGILSDGEGSFCCLGVLCDIAVTEGIIAEGRTRFGDKVYYTDDTTESSAYLVPAVQEWAGITETGTIPYNSEKPVGYPTLADLNDRAGYSFEEIANVIEERL